MNFWKPKLFVPKKYVDRGLQTRQLAIVALRRFGPKAKEAVPALIECLKNPSDNPYQKNVVQFDINRKYSKPDEDNETGFNILALRDCCGDWVFDQYGAFCREAVETLGEMGSVAESAVPTLLEILQERITLQSSRRQIQDATWSFNPDSHQVRYREADEYRMMIDRQANIPLMIDAIRAIAKIGVESRPKVKQILARFR